MTLSVVIPTWSGTEYLADMAFRLAQQVRPMCDELVITEDGNHDTRLKKIADIYLIHEQLGHGANLRTGFDATTGDYVAMIDSDMEITKGSLRDLCVPDRIVCPDSDGRLVGWFVVAPRRIIEEFLPFDASFGMQGIDSWTVEFFKRFEGQAILSSKVSYHHSPNQSGGEWKRQIYLKHLEEMGHRKEVSWDRHKARLLEDPAYAAEWGDVV